MSNEAEESLQQATIGVKSTIEYLKSHKPGSLTWSRDDLPKRELKTYDRSIDEGNKACKILESAAELSMEHAYLLVHWEDLCKQISKRSLSGHMSESELEHYKASLKLFDDQTAKRVTMAAEITSQNASSSTEQPGTVDWVDDSRPVEQPATVRQMSENAYAKYRAQLKILEIHTATRKRMAAEVGLGQAGRSGEQPLNPLGGRVDISSGVENLSATSYMSEAESVHYQASLKLISDQTARRAQMVAGSASERSSDAGGYSQLYYPSREGDRSS